jgi:hypothetical protein
VSTERVWEFSLADWLDRKNPISGSIRNEDVVTGTETLKGVSETGPLSVFAAATEKELMEVPRPTVRLSWGCAQDVEGGARRGARAMHPAIRQ